MPGSCTFNELWLKEPNYSDWILRGKTVHSAKCHLCKKDFSISSMGESALKSHMAGKKHRDRLERTKVNEATTLKITTFLQKCQRLPETSKQPEAAESSNYTKAATSSKVFVTNNATLSAEIRWVLKTVSSHYSYKSSENSKDLFRLMFPDSEIAAKFSCGEKKCAYLCTYGIAPHFKNVLTNMIKGQDGYVLLFDESLNRRTQRKQMDFHVRIWNDQTVATRYFGSEFLGHATAEDMLEKFSSCCIGLEREKLFQLSMDGPNVNWKFHDLVQSGVKKDLNHLLINVGSCGLHVVHGAFKDGVVASGWDVDNFLKSIHTLLKDTPARREDYASVTNTSSYPLKFCKHRWVENVPVLERAMHIFPEMKVYIKAVEAGKVTNPKTKSYDTVKQWCSDPLAMAKMQFCHSLAEQLSPFLTLYQSDKPMMPFLCEDLYKLVKDILRRYVKDEALTSITTPLAISTFDSEEISTHKQYRKIDVGFSAKLSLNNVLKNKQVSERQEMEFRMQCKEFMIKVVMKLRNKSPLQYSLARNLACLDPRNMAKKKDVCVVMFTRVLRSLVEAKRLEERTCDDTVRQFTLYIEEVVASLKSTFSEFEPIQGRIDTLFYTTMAKKGSYCKLWDVVRILLLISHGQATVERGFSTNKQVEVENLREQSFVAQRLICDHVHAVGGVLNVQIDTQLLLAAAGARQKYQTYLDDQKRLHVSSISASNKRKITDEIEALKKRRMDTEKDYEALISSADNYAERAEGTKNLTWITKSNSMRRTAKEKQRSLIQINDDLDAKLKEFKNL